MPKRSNRSYQTRKNPKERREEILLVAERIFEEKGVFSSSISRIMKMVGISQTAFYYYFPKKEDLFVKFVQIQLKATLKSMETIFLNKLSPEQKVAKVFQLGLAIQGVRRRLDRMEDGRPREDPVVHHRATVIFLKPMSEKLALIIEEGAAAGSFRVRDAKATALLMVAIYMEIVHRAATADELVEWSVVQRSLWDAWTRQLGMSEEAAERHSPFAEETKNKDAGE